jgi:hypothetical protein
METLKLLLEAVRTKTPELWPNDWIPHHVSAQVDKMLCVKQFLTQKSITEREQPPNSSDSAPNNFWLFPKIKSALKGRKFQVTEDI